VQKKCDLAATQESSEAARLPPDIGRFCDAYRDAFNQQDGSKIAQLYHVPSGIAHDGGYTHWPTFEAIRDNMVALCRQYQQGGYAVASHVPLALVAQGDNFAFVTLAWTITRHADQPPWQFNTAYNLARTAAGWRVLLCTAYDEKKLPPA
jgi:hypothetical protein